MDMTTDTDTTTDTTGDRGAAGADHLAALEAQAQALETGAQQAQQAKQDQAAQLAADDLAADLLGALQDLRTMAGPFATWWQQYETVWGDRTLKAIAGSGAAVMQRHGWTLGDVLTTWGPYIGLICATAPPSIATYQAIKQHRAQLAAAEQQRNQAQPGGGSHGG